MVMDGTGIGKDESGIGRNGSGIGMKWMDHEWV